MLRTASSAMAGHMCVWLAAALLVFPFVPTSACHCSGEGAVEPCCRANLQHHDRPAIDGGCRAFPMQRARSSCCAKSNRTAAPNDNGPCHCGPTCNCRSSRHSHPRPAAPTPPTRNGTEQVQWVTLAHVAALTVADEADSPFVALPSGEPLFETALDRCITLSRFLC
jgi:hypothetical protein